MCGITARVGRDDGLGELLVGIENLEYRGYDSAGVAVQNGAGIEVWKRTGGISQLRSVIEKSVIGGEIGIGHTRWSTHGAPTDANAHPHTDCDERIAVVHNGIVENYSRLKDELQSRGHVFTSDTDTEVIPHLVEDRLHTGVPPLEAFRQTVRELEGSYAVAMIADGDESVYGARQGSPLVVGIGDGACYLSSDIMAFVEFTDRVVYLRDGDVVAITPDQVEITDAHGRSVEREVCTADWLPDDVNRDGFEHYMLKEIHEQPAAIRRTIRGRIDSTSGEVTFEGFPRGAFTATGDVHLVACGTSYNAALYAGQLLTRRGIPAQVFLGSEYAMFPPPLRHDTVVVGVTQSGETADTLVSLRRANEAGARTVAATNVAGSTAAREVDEALLIRAGPEIGVAATKTFTSQVVLLALFAEHVVRDVTGSYSDQWDDIRRSLRVLSPQVQSLLDGSTGVDIAEAYCGSDAYFFIGRGISYPIALEGALKFKEITYDHAEGFPAGELKHGPLALVTPDTPVIAVFSGRQDEKTISSVKEVQARGAPIIAVAPENSTDVLRIADDALSFPATTPDLAGIPASVQLQLFAYQTAKLLGRPIDKPRNLAKSVTVE